MAMTSRKSGENGDVKFGCCSFFVVWAGVLICWNSIRQQMVQQLLIVINIQYNRDARRCVISNEKSVNASDCEFSF